MGPGNSRKEKHNVVDISQMESSKGTNYGIFKAFVVVQLHFILFSRSDLKLAQSLTLLMAFWILESSSNILMLW